MSKNIKTLIGKNNYLFLINDSGRELDIHCHNLDVIKDKSLSRYEHKNFLIVVFPNKSLQCKQYLPDKYNPIYRPGIEVYKNKFDDKILDSYQFLEFQNEIFYKTDTHMNLKGTLKVYYNFIKKANTLYNLNLECKHDIILQKKTCELSSLNYGIGDLTWETNLGNQVLETKIDTYYYSDDIEDFYIRYKIFDNPKIRFLNENLEDCTSNLENKIVDFDILGEYIIHTCRNKTAIKILIFYDSFLLNTLSLYFELFENAYFSKSVYENEIVNLIKPDYVFEFRVERFLF